jgi:hypothetical protein
MQGETVMRNVSTERCRLTLAMIAAGLLAAMASSASAQSVEDVIAKNIKAQGGREALLALKAIERKGTVAVDGSFGQMEGTVEEILIPWKKAVRSLDLAVFQQTDGYNGKTAWRDGMMGIQEVEGEEANQIKQSVDVNPFLMMADRGAKAEKLDDEKIEDVAYTIVQLTPKDRPPIKFFLDKETGLVKRTTLKQKSPQFGEVEVVVELSGYEKFGAVTLPTKNAVTLGEALKIDTTYTETKVDGKVDEAIFEMPKAEAEAK